MPSPENVQTPEGEEGSRLLHLCGGADAAMQVCMGGSLHTLTYKQKSVTKVMYLVR